MLVSSMVAGEKIHARTVKKRTSGSIVVNQMR